MLIVLPFSFGVGFCTGYFWQDYRSPLWLQFRTIQERIRAIRLERFGVPLLAIALIAALFLTEEVVRVFLLQRVLETAAIVVGAAAGVWFKSETRTRDQLAFIAGAGLLLFLAALEYDYKIFRNLSKIGGSEFSVEFTNSSEGAARGPGPQAPGNDQGNGQSFPGAFGLDTALEYLKATPAFIAQDEQYADLFSGMPQQLKDPSADMRALNKSMLSYVCKTVYPIAVQLGELHHIFRGETSVVTINPELVSALRQEYFRQRNFTDAGRGAPKSLDKALIALAVGMVRFRSRL
jgi:hypothetical protein